MRRGVETLGIAYVVVASLYGGAMYFAANKIVADDLTNAPVYAYQAAREKFPEADKWIADAAARFHEQYAAPLADLRRSSPLRGSGVEVMVAEAPSLSSVSSGEPVAQDEAPKFDASGIVITEEYFAPIEAARLTQRVEARLRDNLTSDHYSSFDLFIYVSKAGSGPWAQQMYVFEKQGGQLELLHNWPVSTGRERTERTPTGITTSTVTPAGYFQFDAGRMFRNYRSVQWNNAPMPNAMFFNWMNQGRLTGIAIHGVLGRPVASIGARASAGCVRLSPESAEILFDLVRGNYQGRGPRFDFDNSTKTLSREGELARGEDGELQYADGYRALIFIDTFGGEKPTAIF
ncbi:MAG: L,D-transpeptidase [Alphaproteobacteria bacterium]